MSIKHQGSTDLQADEKALDITTTVFETKQHQIEEPQDVDLSSYDYTKEESKAIVRKFDLHILPLAWWAYLFNSLDRNNASNAKSAGMTEDLNFPNNGYSTMLCVYFTCLCAFGVPGLWLTRKIGPSYTIPGIMFGWGSMAMVNAAVNNYASCLAVRGLLGVFEAPFAGTLIYYLTTFYTRGELGMRIAAFYSCNALSGAFSGLIGYGVFQLESSLKGWQILFLIEGGFTVACSIIIFFLLPISPAKATFLNDRQKKIARLRCLRDGSQAVGTKLQNKAFFKPLKDPKYYVFAIIAVCYGTATTLASSFLTQIIGRFGYSTVKTNLFTVAPYACGTVVLFITAYSSDHFRERGFHLVSALTLVTIGCILLAALPVSVKGPAYFATFLISMGSFTPSILFHSWHQCNEPSEDGRAFRVGSLTFLANTGGLVSSNIFRDQWAPHYVIPLIITACLEVLGITLIVSMRLWMGRQNRLRNKAQNVKWTSKDVPTEVLSAGPSNPLFRYFV
ncbi:high-affinity nicotinic acid transporter [Cryptococcus neoformans AD2-60a]|nr:high-affinity nicotinic acid transporter [Cryptococcus neoformans var. grubii AD2-60a]OXG33230.1 high-affinity nicotinic acid transporter [Cryptococcus neoformans var. grubii Bt120]